jgi:hypothetical protein
MLCSHNGTYEGVTIPYRPLCCQTLTPAAAFNCSFGTSPQALTGSHLLTQHSLHVLDERSAASIMCVERIKIDKVYMQWCRKKCPVVDMITWCVWETECRRLPSKRR